MSLVEKHENNTYASESSRWYTRDGRSVEDVIGKNGQARKATLRDARKEGWIPSVTSILQVMAKPELELWKMREVAKFCADAHYIGDGENIGEWASWAVDQAKTRMAQARDTGSDVHGQIDQFLLYQDELSYAHSAYTVAASAALIELGVAGHQFKIETSFCDHRVAGKCDLHCVEPAWIVDWKTTNKPLNDGKVPDYDEYCAQLAAYSMGIFGQLTPHCFNVFLSTSNPGAWAICKWSHDDLLRGWDLYCACRKLWQVKNRYDF